MKREREEDLEESIEERLAVAERTLEALCGGEIDALVVRTADGQRIFTLEGAETPCRMFVEQMQEGAVFLQRTGTIRFANRALAALLAVPHDSLPGRPFVDFVAEPDRDRFRVLLKDATRHPRCDEIRLAPSVGPIFPVLVSAAPTTGENSEVVSLVVTDLSWREAERKRRESDHRKDEFIAMLAHELRNPLAAISSAAFLARRPGTSPEQVALAWQVMGRQVKQVGRLVDDLLDVSRISRGKIALRREPLDFSSICTDAVEAARLLFDERRQKFSAEIAPGLRVDGDAGRLEQAIGNLLSNAAKYTPYGGTVTFRAFSGCGFVVLSVKDSGIGVPPEMRQAIFEPFVQLHQTREKQYGGLGIGLTLVKKIAELHGGAASVTSSGEGMGSEFTLRLPACTHHARRAAMPRVADSPAAAPVSLLIVDDHADGLTALGLSLEALGCRVTAARDGEGAVRALDAGCFDAVVLDLGLPGVDGYELARQLIAADRLAGARLIALTGYGSAADVERSRRVGFHKHLVKPVDAESLLAEIHSLRNSAPGPAPRPPAPSADAGISPV